MRPELASLPAAESLPVVGRAFRLGVNPVTTTLVLLGPVLIAVVGVVGRSPATTALGIAYVLSVPASVAYFALTGHDPSPTDGADGDAGDGDGGDAGDGADGDGGEGEGDPNGEDDEGTDAGGEGADGDVSARSE